jgi:hypothetical protein
MMFIYYVGVTKVPRVPRVTKVTKVTKVRKVLQTISVKVQEKDILWISGSGSVLKDHL